jgi:hypothetical protein
MDKTSRRWWWLGWRYITSVTATPVVEFTDTVKLPAAAMAKVTSVMEDTSSESAMVDTSTTTATSSTHATSVTGWSVTPATACARRTTGKVAVQTSTVLPLRQLRERRLQEGLLVTQRAGMGT